MCQSSFNHLECLNDTCSLYHVKGTRRMNSRPLHSDSHTDRRKDRTTKSAHSHSQSKSASSEKDTFLDLLRIMKQEMLEVMNTKNQQMLEAMDRKIQEARMQHPAQEISQTPMTLDHLIPPVTSQSTKGYRLIPC